MTDRDTQHGADKFDDKGQIMVIDVLANDTTARFPSLASKEEEKQVVRKLDRRIIPMLCVVYLFSALDRTNLANARLQGLPQDILHGDPTGVLFDWITSMCYFPFIICQMPCMVMLKLYSPRILISWLVIGWGLSATLMATAFSFPGILVARLSLGMFEAGFSPGFPLYLSLFYTREEMGVRMTTWMSFSAVAGAFGGLIAFGIQDMHGPLATWRVLLLIEGIPSVFLGLLSFHVFPDRPEETSILTQREREIAIERADRGGKADARRVLQREHIPIAFRDWKLYAAGIMYFGGDCAVGGIQGFLPTIIASFGFTNSAAQILTVPPYAVAAMITCATMYFSDRLQRRGVFLIGAYTLAGIGYILLVAFPSNIRFQYFATFCTTAGTYTGNCLIMTWFSHNLGSETKRTIGIPLYMTIGHCGTILGSHLFPKTDAPHYVKGFAVTCSLLFLSAVLAGILTIYYTVENKRRDEIYGKPDPAAPVDVSKLADEAPNFRYTP